MAPSVARVAAQTAAGISSSRLPVLIGEKLLCSLPLPSSPLRSSSSSYRCLFFSTRAAPHHRHRKPSGWLLYNQPSPASWAAIGTNTHGSSPPPPSSSPSAFSHSLPLQTQTRRCHHSSSTMAPIPTNMKAVQIGKNGGTEVLEYKDVPVPSLSEGQVLVRNDFSGVNFIDTYFRTGLYPAPRFPLTLGREGAGEVVAAHDSVKSKFPPGTKVVYLPGVFPGTYCEYSNPSAENLVPVPDGLTTEQAAAAMLQGLTAWTLVREAADVKAGQWALVHAAAGGTGGLLVQMLRIVGAKIVATASTDEKLELARKNGADYTVNSNEDIVAKVKEITGGHGIDAIFDGVGKATFDADLEMIALNGHLISFGNASGAVPPVSILKLGPKNVRLMRPILFGFISTRDRLEKFAGELFDMIVSKKLEVAVHKVYSLADAAQAHKDLESRGTKGKLLLKCS